MKTARRTIRIATRGSALALAQSTFIQGELQHRFPDHTFELKIIKTTGDKLQKASMAQNDPALPRGLFTKELEEAMLSGKADLAVHSLKDLPTQLPEGLCLGATTVREDVRDVLVYVDGRFPTKGRVNISTLPANAIIATSSTRRAAQLKARRADLQIVPIRGNVGTRLQKLADNADWHGTILAAAGLSRLNFIIARNGTLSGPNVPAGLKAVALSTDEMLPCVGQAALGIEIRAKDPVLEAICHQLNHAKSWACVLAERAFLRAMGGGCQSAVAAHAIIQSGQLRLRAVSFLGKGIQQGMIMGAPADAEALGTALAESLRPKKK